MKVAALQYTALDDIAHNCEIAQRLIAQAAEKGANLICLPECANLLAKDKDSLFAKAETESQSAFLEMACKTAQRYQVTLSLGSLMIRPDAEDTANDGRIANRHFIIAPDGAITARYDKIHMFDADVNDGKTYRESDSFRAGTSPVMTKIDGHLTGLSICYDIRFAGLYHHYAAKGAEILLSPAAFTAKTGQAHWHILQRARAIETASFLIAAAQKGTHDDGRQTYGHALIISPWGAVLDDAGTHGDMALATLDFNEVRQARSALSAWQHQHSFPV